MLWGGFDAGGRVSEDEGEMKRVGELTSPLSFAGATASPLVAAGIGQNEQSAGVGGARASLPRPASSNSLSDEGGSVREKHHG